MRTQWRSIITRVSLTTAICLVGGGVIAGVDASGTSQASPMPGATPAVAAREWPIDRAHSRVTFTVTKWGFAEVEGRFFDFAGTIAYDAARPEASRVAWRVKVASVETGA